MIAEALLWVFKAFLASIFSNFEMKFPDNSHRYIAIYNINCAHIVAAIPKTAQKSRLLSR